MKSAILEGLTLKQLAVKTWRGIRKHDYLGRAAELAFYFQLALFPLLIVLLNLVSLMPRVQEIILFWLSRLMPADASRIVETWVQNVFANRSRGFRQAKMELDPARRTVCRNDFYTRLLSFSTYIRYSPSYNATYGSIGAVIVLMLWLYLMGLIMYIGGEINAQIAAAAGKRAAGS